MTTTNQEVEINFLEPASIKYLDNLKAMEFSKTVKSSYAPERVETWYGYSSNLQSVKDGRSLVEWAKDLPDWLDELRLKYFPTANSVLICRGTKADLDTELHSNTSIDWHRDHGNFHNRVVMINYGMATFYLHTYNNGTLIHTLKDCDVVDFDSKLLHKSSQLANDRYIITFRQVKREFLVHKLF
jgi:hypothetical protein